MRILLVSLATALLCGCASQPEPTRQNFAIKVAWMRRANINDVISRIGPPSSTYVLPDGDTMYSFIRGSREPARVDYLDMLLDPVNYNRHPDVVHYCRIDLTVGKGDQYVIDQRITGDLCVATLP